MLEQYILLPFARKLSWQIYKHTFLKCECSTFVQHITCTAIVEVLVFFENNLSVP